jgi:hypothetical protein
MLFAILTGAAVGLALVGAIAALAWASYALGFWASELLGVNAGIVELAMKLLASLLKCLE